MESEKSWRVDTTDWFSSEEWKELGERVFCLKSDDGKSMFTYENLGIEDEKESFVEMVLWVENDAFVLQKEIIDGKVEHYFIVPPYEMSYMNPRDSWCGVVYCPDGKMEKNRNVKGLPKRIDMEKTIELFIKQVAEKRFTVPILVRQIKK